MGYVARYTRGQYILDISSGIYSLLDGFQPPTTIEAPNFASGTSANRAAGSQLVSRRAVDRDFSFQVLIDGDSTAEGDMGVEAIDAFLRLAGDEDEPTYFEWRPDNNVSVEPLWGQLGAYRRVKVLAGQATKGGIQSSAQADGKHVARITQTIAPYALGKRQRLAQARGAVIDERAGSTTGRRRGIIMISGGTNYFTNPVFDNPTYNTNWNLETAEIISEQNTDPNFVLFGHRSAKLINTSTTAKVFYESINVGDTDTHYLSCYVKRPDGAAVTSADCNLFYTIGLASTYISVGNGWYRLTASATGIVGAIVTGIQVAAGRTVYVDGFQIIVSGFGGDYPNIPLLYGDRLGCYWTGTNHASTSGVVSINPYLRVPGTECINGSIGTIRMVYRVRDTSANMGVSSIYFFSTTGGPLKAYFQGTDDTIHLVSGANNAASSAKTFAVDDILILHFTWSKANGISIYINGAVDGTASHTVFTTPAHLYINSFANGTLGGLPFAGELLDFATFEKELTATEALNDYTNILQAAQSNDSLEGVPFEWTKDGDSIIDLTNDATAVTDNFALVAGIPGSAPADTIIHATIDTAGRAVILANNPFGRYLDMSDTFIDRQGTVVAAALNGEVERLSVNTTEVEIPAATRISIAYDREAYYNKAAYVYCSLADAGANLRARLKANFTTDLVLTGDYQSITTDASLRNFLIGPLRIPYGPERQFEWVGASSTLNFYVGFYRSTAGAANVDFDFYQLLVGQIAYIVPTAANVREYLIREGRAWAFNSGATQQRETPEYRGDPIRFEPGKINHLVVMSKAHGTLTTLNATVTLTRAYIIPRYTIL